MSFFKIIFSFTFWTLDVTWTVSYELTLVRQWVCPFLCWSVYPSVHPSLSFFKIGSLVFSGIVHDDSWSWHLLTDRATFLKKKTWQAEFGPNGPKLGPKLFFFYFLKCGSLRFLEIACNDSLQQWLTSSRGKTHERNFWGPHLCQRGQNQAEN